MRKWTVLGAAAVVMLAVLVADATRAEAQDQGAWRAASSNATSITSDIAILKDKVSIDF